ncbi:MAG: hypothetical protein JW795_02595 [Chitinivibrionales bacterium]|nr:hypothetical protein [Chitinivibrionales bacterium]
MSMNITAKASTEIRIHLKSSKQLCHKLQLNLFSLSLLSIVLLFNATAQCQIADSINKKAWHYFMNNKVLEAQSMFKSAKTSPQKRIAAAGCRGLSYTQQFLGQPDSAASLLFQSFLLDADTVLFDASVIGVLCFSRDWVGSTMKEGYQTLDLLTKNPTFYNGCYKSMLADRFINDGKLDKAKKIIAGMGIVRQFMMIGPFENISGSGYQKKYPPESDLHFSQTYRGKDGSTIGWHLFENNNPSGWVFTEYSFSTNDAILYYYATVHSPKTQDVYLGFGASGSFKIFLNNNCICADSLFRNTGTDMFMQKVTLYQGDNTLLIKIGNESRSSNFLVRFVDERGMMANVSYSSNAPQRQPSKKGTNQTVASLTNSPFSQRIERYLGKRIAADSSDGEAAVLLMDYYNGSELFEQGQALAEAMLRRYPKSSLWHDFYSESLQRSLKLTKAQMEKKAASLLCNLNFSAWNSELQNLSSTASSRTILDFIAKAPSAFQLQPQTLMSKLNCYFKLNNESNAYAVIDLLFQKYRHNREVVPVLTDFFISQGNIQKTEKMLMEFLKFQNSSTDIYSSLASVYLKMGDRQKAIKTYKKCLSISPNSAGFYYYLAKQSLYYKEMDEAINYINKAIAIAPTSSPLLAMRGTIRSTRGENAEAIKDFSASIDATYNNFEAWDQLLTLLNMRPLSQLTTVPDPDSVKLACRGWTGLSNENGAICASTKDVFIYPSRCSSERYFLMVHLPTQNAIDIWKEYSIAYNSYHQALTITKSYAKSPSGKESPADVNGSEIVFKTLQPGDDIVLEWTLENYYQQDMAQQVWGDYRFSRSVPVYFSELRLVVPLLDSISFTLCGDSIRTVRDTIDNFTVTRMQRFAYTNPLPESFSQIDPPSTEKAFYSTIPSWSQVSNWYLNLTENKLMQTVELKTLLDSILAFCTTEEEKIKEIHRTITQSIRYSFIPFRQSAWIPQPAHEVMVSKIGDCKDMASLAKTMLDYCGIESHLVLVNTKDENSTTASYIGPDFNHCIVNYRLNGKDRYLDLTDNSTSCGTLPQMDQGALALVIKKDNDSLIHLPMDSTTDRTIVRTITSSIDSSGNLKRTIVSMKNGIFASSIRQSYRFLSPAERKKSLQSEITQRFVDATIDTVTFSSLDSLTDSITYTYGFSAEQAAMFSGNAVIVPLNLPDIITAGSIPSTLKRTTPMDLSQTWFGIGTFQISGTLTVAKEWQLLNSFSDVTLSGAWGSYSMQLRKNKSTISFQRLARFNFNNPITAQNYPSIRDVFLKIARTDNVQLLFLVKPNQ